MDDPLLVYTTFPDEDTGTRIAEALVREAAGRGAQIVCLKELFNTPYFAKSTRVEHFDLAEPVPGPVTDRFQALARELAVVIAAAAPVQPWTPATSIRPAYAESGQPVAVPTPAPDTLPPASTVLDKWKDSGTLLR